MTANGSERRNADAVWHPLSPEELYVAGLFDGDWYRARNPDVGAQDALLHFIAIGDREARAPSDRFDPQFYLSQLPEGLGKAAGPVEHFLRVGRDAGLISARWQPGPPFLEADDTGVEPAPVPEDVLAPALDLDIEANAIVKVEAEAEAAFPKPPTDLPGPVIAAPWPPLTSLEIYHSGLFEEAWYVGRHVELDGHANPLAHFVERGDALGWSPSRRFDSAWYLDQLGGDLEGASGPVLHFLRKGLAEGRTALPDGDLTALLAASPIFDEAWYIDRHPECLGSPWSPLSFFLTEGIDLDHDPGPFFSTDWYRDQYAGQIPATFPAFPHYIREGEALGFWPNAAFDPVAYEALKPSGRAAGQLDRYLIHAETSGDWDCPGFDTAFYVRDNPDIDFSRTPPAAHFAATGWRECRAPLRSLETRDALPAGVVAFDILIDGWHADAAGLRATLESVTNQVRGVWRASVMVDPVIWNAVAPSKSMRDRIVVLSPDNNRGVRLARLLKEATGDYLIVLDGGDRLEAGALGALADRLRYDRLDVLYTDECRDAATPTDPAVVLKPDWSPELLTEYNYFGRLTAIRTAAAREAGGFSREAGEAAEWDLNLRLADRSRRIGRLPRRLCVRAPDADLDRPLPASRRAADFRAVLETYWRSKGNDVTVATRPDGTTDARWPIVDPPKVSVIIPTRDGVALLKRVIDGLVEDTDYPALEILVVDNLSEKPRTLTYLRQLESQGIRVVSFEETFNYSAVCNAGARAATGDLLLFLNNDIEVVSPDWLQAMVRMAQRPGVGVVGAMLVYPGGELQHAGVALGVDMAGLVFRGCGLDQWTVFGAPNVARNWLAIMGACQMVSREAFDAVSGFDETYRVAHSDVALCLHAWQAGYRTAYTPDAVLRHHEGATRGRRNPPEDTLRAGLDIEAMGLTEDPYYHPDLDPRVSVPTLRDYGIPDARSTLADAIAWAKAGAPKASRLDPRRVGLVAAAVGQPADRLKWSSHDSRIVKDLWSAARFIIDAVIADRGGVPDPAVRPLSSGSTGRFARTLIERSRRVPGLDDQAVGYLVQAFDASLSARTRRVLIGDPDARWASPLGLTPAGLKEAMVWLFKTGMARHDLRREEIWWWALEQGEHADQALADTWRITPDWQARVPDALSPTGAQTLLDWLELVFDLEAPWASPEALLGDVPAHDQITLAYHAREAWRRRIPEALSTVKGATALVSALQADPASSVLLRGMAPKALKGLADDLARPGVNLVGRFKPGGVTEAVAGTAVAGGLAVSERALPELSANVRSDVEPERLGLELHDATLLCLKPDQGLADVYAQAGLRPRSKRTRRIGYWEWSHDLIPATWASAAESLDEVWTTTRFAADRIAERIGLPVHVLPPGVNVEDPIPDWPPGHPFVFVADAGCDADVQRRNTTDVIAAFRKAFGQRDDVRLIVDVSRLKAPAALAALRAEAGRASITFEAQASGAVLLALSHAYVALPLTSDLDLRMLDAMRAGRATVTLAHSGSLDLVSEATTDRVDFSEMSVPPGVAGYAPGSTWARPSIAHAAKVMAALAADPTRARRLGTAARAMIVSDWSAAVRGTAMKNRLEEASVLSAGPRPPA